MIIPSFTRYTKLHTNAIKVYIETDNSWFVIAVMKLIQLKLEVEWVWCLMILLESF